MKKLLLMATMLCMSLTTNAQKDVTTFLGIPVDGTKAEMIRQLKAKGFTSNSYDPEILEGEFNGNDVNLHIVTNNNKVYRIVVADAKTVDESNIKINFNRLCDQFASNTRYVSLMDHTISDEEDISYEMIVNKKRYQASFYQKPTIDSAAMVQEMEKIISSKFSPEELSNPSETTSKKIQDIVFNYASEKIFKKSVWFMIVERYGKYSIAIYYDNEYNCANGEDL